MKCERRFNKHIEFEWKEKLYCQLNLKNSKFCSLFAPLCIENKFLHFFKDDYVIADILDSIVNVMFC